MFKVQSQSPYIATHVCFMAKQWALVSDMRHIPGQQSCVFLYDIRMFLYYSAMNNGSISLILSFKVEQLYNLFRLRHESFKEKHYEKTHIVAPHDVHIGGDLCTN